jgi:hypothetical protein
MTGAQRDIRIELEQARSVLRFFARSLEAKNGPHGLLDDIIPSATHFYGHLLVMCAGAAIFPTCYSIQFHIRQFALLDCLFRVHHRSLLHPRPVPTGMLGIHHVP